VAPYVKLRRPNPKHVVNEAERDALFTKESIKAWLRGISPDSHAKIVNILHRFLMYREKQGLESDPDKVIQQVRKGTNETRIEHLKAAKDWLEDQDEMGYANVASRLAYFKAIKSFYRHNLVDLPMGKLDLRASIEEEVEVTAEPSATEFLKLVKRVLEAGKLGARNRALLLVKLQSFCDNKVLCNVFNYVAYPQLVKHFGTDDFRSWDPTKVPVRIDLVRPKNHYRYFTFLDRDAIAALKDWLQARERLFGKIRVHGSTNPKLLPRSDPIFVARFKEVRPLSPWYISTMLNRVAHRAGVNETPNDDLPKDKRAKRRYAFHEHEVRDTAITLARRVRADKDVIEFFCGHKIDALGYDKSARDVPDLFREEYRKLAPYLNVVSGKEEELRITYEQRLQSELRKHNAELEERVRTLEDERTAMIKADQLRVDQIEDLVNKAIAARLAQLKAKSRK